MLDVYMLQAQQQHLHLQFLSCVSPPTHTHTHKIFVIRISLLFLPIITVVEKENIEYRQSCNLISGSDHLLFGIIIYFCSTSLDLKDLAQECIGGNM